MITDGLSVFRRGTVAPSEQDAGDDENRAKNQQSDRQFSARNEDAGSDRTRPNDMKDSSLVHKACTERMNLIPLKGELGH